MCSSDLDLPQLISDHKSKDYRNGFRVGVLDLSSLELRWVDLHVDEIKGMGGTDIHQLAISNDGRYIAAGCHVSDVMIDTVEQKVLWNGNSTKPFACLSLPVFSSDGSKVYVGDAISSNVVLLDTRTGDSIKQWHATETGRVIRGRSLACIAVSPDDNWVAVGAQMRGEVYLINTHSDGPPVVLQQKGGPRALSFSPDSKRLACMAGDVISIWEVPAGGPSAAPPKQAPAAGAKEASP
mgnify:CR=1 FL=1